MHDLTDAIAAAHAALDERFYPGPTEEMVAAAIEAAAPLIAAKALREAADDLERRINEPGLILAADKYGGYHAGERSRGQREADVLRSRADAIEAGQP